MAEYIEREALLENMTATVLPQDAQHLYLAMRGMVRNAPSADVVEVRHGVWIKDTRTADVCAEYRCSLCGFMYCEADPKYQPYKYCPECGSKNE